MKKKFASKLFIASSILVSTALIAGGSVTLAWFLGPNIEADDKYLNGDIGLRNYFYSGDGTEEKPYEIVSPIHYYNLTRLQNLGIFPNKKYFQIGHVFDIEGVPTLKCINRYDENSEPIYEDFLDMSVLPEATKIFSIGGEGVPFVGEIDGNGMPIKNLKVVGNPEDVGVFGYVAHQGVLEGLVFDNLEVTSLGYNNNVSKADNALFSEDIDDIFHSASYLATETSLTFYDHNSVTGDYDATNLKKLNGASGTAVTNINSTDNVISGTKYFDGYFKPTFPTSGDERFTYSMISSNPVLVPVGDLTMQGSDEKDFTFDFTSLYDSVDFNSRKDYQVNSKIYLVASTVVDGYTFSRVIQSYTIEIYSNSSIYEEGNYSVAIFCDYVEQGDGTDHNTGYHHGNNVGLVAGHVDGTCKNCFVYNGQIIFNETGYHPIKGETDTALIGEVGKNVKNDIDPDLGLVVHGDIGIMNFSRIYSLIRSDMTYPKTIKAGQRTPEGATSVVNYVSYKEFINPDSIDMFSDYLRYYDGKKEQYEFITKTDTSVGTGVWKDYPLSSTIPTDFNSVDFLWNRVVEDEENIDRGLGVFKVVSSYNSAAQTGAYGVYMASNLGDCRIINGKPKDKVYFSTAEYDHQKYNDGVAWDAVNDVPKKATDLPSYSDVMSFDYPFSRDFNYCFELDLSQMSKAKGNDYMYNTDSDFLTNYLSSRLIDKYGRAVEPFNPRFGFMFRSSENEILSSLSSYMPIGKPGNKHPFSSEGTTKYYPSNSIVFSIDNPNGANVSVVGNGEDITIYGYDPDSDANDVTPLYTMRSKNTKEKDMHRYFTYDVETGATGTKTVEIGNSQTDEGVLYGHIFKLPKGDYVIGSNNPNAKANIFFLAVQGQTDGTIGNMEILSLDDKLENVDFLLTAPEFINYPEGLDKALFSFRGAFNTSSGVIINDVYTIGDKKYMRVTFDEGLDFVISMRLRSRKTEHIFMFNGVLYDAETHDFLAD